MAAGLFISFEGIEGSGKSTQLQRLRERLESESYVVRLNQEPGGTEIGRHIRRLLLDPANDKIAPETELLLMFASRAQAAAETIRPALARQEIVLSDRFTDSSLVYQGVGRGLGRDTVMALHRIALQTLVPDLTLYLVLDVETGLRRVGERLRDSAQAVDESRIDRQSLAFHRQIAEAYARLAAEEPHRIATIEAHDAPDAVAERIWQRVIPILPRR